MSKTVSKRRADDGLILIDDGWGGGALHMVVGISVLIVTGVIVFGTGLVDTIAPLKRPKLLGTELEEDQAQRASASLWDGSLARLFERDYDLTSRVRKRASDPYAQFLLEHLHETSGSVLMGFDGWLFTTRRMDFPDDDPSIGTRRAAEIMRAIERRLGSHGARFVVIPVPRKCVIESDRLPFGVDPQAELDRDMVQVLRKHGVETVDIPSAFHAWQGRDLYRAIDTHWTTDGMRLAAEVTAQYTGLLAAPGERFGELSESDENRVHRYGDLMQRLGLKLDHEHRHHYDRGPWMVQAGGGRDAALLAELKANRRQAWILVGTSYSTDTFAAFVSHYVGRPVVERAIAANMTYQSLLDALKRPPFAPVGHGAMALPPVIFAEIPNYQLLLSQRKPEAWAYPPGMDELIALVPPAEALEIPLATSLLELARATALPWQLDVPKVLFELESGQLARSADGIVEVRLDVELSEGPGWVGLISGRFADRVQIPSGRTQLVLPLLGDGQLTSGVRMTIEGPEGCGATIHELRLCSNSSEVPLGKGRVLPMPSGGDGAQEIHFAAPVIIDRYDGLLFDRTGTASAQEVVVQCYRGAEPVGEAWSIEELAAGAPVVLSLTEIIGSEVDRVVVRSKGTGLPMGPLVNSAALIGLRAASERRGLGPIRLPK